MTEAAGQTRLPAAERRQAIVDAALTVFSTGSYSGATTAQIAKEAGISEPILYRHFPSKRDLYFACLDAAWERLQDVFVEKLEGAGGAASAPGDFALRMRRNVRVLPPTLWTQALTEAGQDPEVANYLRRHMREVHEFVAGSIRRSQANGWIDGERDADAEAWIFIGGMLLLAVADRLGNVLSADDFAAIAAERVKWLSGGRPGP